MKNVLFIILILAISFVSCKKDSGNTAKEAFVDSLINEMTIDEKIGQMTLLTSSWGTTGPTMRDDYLELIKSGKCGNLFNAHTVEFNRKFQKVAVEETRLGIPLLFGYDIIHGYKTIFPIPLAESCSWEPELIKESARFASMEAAAGGITWTFNPMVDITTDPRWGRVAEGAGEDAYLGSIIAKAKVEGHQGDDLSDPFTLAACVKHFAAYGDPMGGRDYNTVDMSMRKFKEDYLPPFQAAFDANVATVMTAFNELFGVPATGSKFLLTELLRQEMGFEGMVVTDYTSIQEMIPHGYARNEKHSGELAVNAGVDMDMQGATFHEYLKESVEEGKVSEKRINQSVRNILELKYDLGLFEDPYRYLDKSREDSILFHKKLMGHALQSARKSIVLLENKPFKGKRLLPLSKNTKDIALIGPLADNKESMLGTWHASGDETKVITVKEGIEKKFPEANIRYAKGCGFEGNDKSGFTKAVNLAGRSDVVILAVGENWQQNGEAASRSNIGLPGLQKKLVQEVAKTGKPVIVLLMAGRPLAVPWIAENIPAVLNTWHLGTRAGDAIADVLSGEYNPSGKLTITFPRNEGQIPVFYSHKNTGRPFDADNKYTSKYLDVSNEPLYPFGYGLSYTSFEYSDIVLNKEKINLRDTLTATVTVENTGDYPGEEIVQLYVRDMVGSVTRPVKELKGFKKISLNPNDSEIVKFHITAANLKFYDAEMDYVAEPGQFKLFIGSNSEDVKEVGFELVK